VKQLKPSAITDPFLLCLLASFVEAMHVPATAQMVFRWLPIEEETG
jgi:hypothetical protein